MIPDPIAASDVIWKVGGALNMLKGVLKAAWTGDSPIPYIPVADASIAITIATNVVLRSLIVDFFIFFS